MSHNGGATVQYIHLQEVVPRMNLQLYQANNSEML